MPLEVQRALRAVPLRVDPDGAVVLAGSDPSADLARVGRPARLAMAPASQVDAVLGLRADAPPPPAPAGAVAAPGRRRRRARAIAVAGVVLLGASLYAAYTAGRRVAAMPATAVVQAGLPPSLVLALDGGDLAVLDRAAALAEACDGRPAVVLRPLADAPCVLRETTPTTIGATIVLAPGGGCVDEARARGLTAALRDRPAPAEPPPDARPLAVRAEPGRACVSPDRTTMQAGVYPLTRVAVVVTAPGEDVPARLADDLRGFAERAPVTTLVAQRAVS